MSEALAFLDDLLSSGSAQFVLSEIERELRVQDALACEASLYTFLQRAWPWFDPAPFVGGWHLEAIAEHLSAVSAGQIKRLLINIPPRHCKTLLTSIAWPCWTWAKAPDPENPLVGPGVRFLCASYGANKAQGDGVTARRLIGSTWYADRWGDRVQISPNRDNQEQFDNEAGGSRISTGIPESLGKGGIIRLIDDPTKTDEVESEKVSETVIRAYDEVWTTRSNDPTNGAEVIIMQRLGERDLSGHVLDRGGFVHLCLPAEYEPARHCRTSIGWSDPRTEEGEPLWPERFDAGWMRRQAQQLGPFAWAGQFQQSPVPRGGGIIRRDWWCVWPPEDEEDSWVREVEVDGVMRSRTRLPDFEWICVSVDTAYTDKQQNDWSACSVWGVFEWRNRPRIMLLHAWQERLELHDLVERIKETARRKGREADAVLVEGKASGISVVQELRRLTREEEFQLIAIDPKGDKTARAHAVVPLFTGGLVYAPKTKWADLMIDNVAQFPRARHDDLFDTATQALMYMRRTGLAQLASEVEAEQDAALWFHGRKRSVAEEYGLA
jgi:predicted phage terminase large subunit-like protein